MSDGGKFTPHPPRPVPPPLPPVTNPPPHHLHPLVRGGRQAGALELLEYVPVEARLCVLGGGEGGGGGGGGVILIMLLYIQGVP